MVEADVGAKVLVCREFGLDVVGQVIEPCAVLAG